MRFLILAAAMLALPLLGMAQQGRGSNGGGSMPALPA